MTRLELYEAGLCDREIAERVGKERSTIGLWRRARGLPANRPRSHISAEAMALRRARYDAGMTDRQIAEAEGVKPKTIAHWREYHCLASWSKARGHSERGDAVIVSLDYATDLGARYGATPDPSWSTWLEEMGASAW